MDKVAFQLNVNGRDRDVLVEPRKLLSDVIREDIGLTGTHVGCEHGVCGACTVLIEGRPQRACLVFAIQVQGKVITTIEDATDEQGDYSPLQQALHEEHGLQCGFCTPGIVVTMEAFLKKNPDPSEHEIREALSGNLCRCTGYQNIVKAVQKAVHRIRDDDIEVA
ncbi:MAG: (2Fe-2S)-binding protein [Rhodospirillales bacterium]|nr:(2Fe-2S)-binding protein [Rhodospirillales bacterium]